MNEKQDYEREAKIRDMATLLKEQKMQIMEYEERLITMKAEYDAIKSKSMLGLSPAQGSFLTNPSIINMNPSFLSTGDEKTHLRQKQKDAINTESGGSGAQPDIKEEEEEYHSDYN